MTDESLDRKVEIGTLEWATLVDQQIHALKDSYFDTAGRVIVLQAALGVLAAKLAEVQPQTDVVITAYLALVREMVSNPPGAPDRTAAMMVFDLEAQVERLGITIRSAVGATPKKTETPPVN